MFYRKYIFGGVAVYYAEVPAEGREGTTTVGFTAYPADLEIDVTKLCLDGMIQAAYTGDEGLIDYAFGVTMRNREATIVKVERQTADGSGVCTELSDGKGNFYIHSLRYDEKTGVFTVSVTYRNQSDEIRTLEMLESLSLSGICAPATGTTRGLTLHRMTSAWSRECRLKSEPFCGLGLDMSWARYGVKCEKWGQIGSMPNRGYYPFAAIEDGESGVIWGMTVEAPFSWQLEVYEEKETCALSGGLADYEYGHWRKEILPNERFTTHNAYFTVQKGGGVNAVCNAFLHEADSRLTVPESEEDMPVVFNEWCTTWGDPSEKNVLSTLAALKPFPVKIFVIDAGWFKPRGRDWGNCIGDWVPSEELFPNGIKYVADEIRRAGMTPGIWFEFEIAGRDSECFSDGEKLLKRDGAHVTEKNRRFFDLRKEETERHLNGRMLRFLRENGFGYLKIDYNDPYGIGCDSEDGSVPAEGGRQVAEASIEWLDRIKDAVPGIVIENCSSGGSRIEPLRMSKVSMCSFSDAHECSEIPLVAANVSRVVPARQMQIWAVLRKQDAPSRTIYSLCAAMLGRVGLSGDVIGMPQEKIKLILDGLRFYEAVKHIVRYGDVVSVDCDVAYYRDPKGRQIYTKEYLNQRLVVIHFLKGGSRSEEIALEGYRLSRAYTDLNYREIGGMLSVCGGEFQAGAFLLEKTEDKK